MELLEKKFSDNSRKERSPRSENITDISDNFDFINSKFPFNHFASPRLFPRKNPDHIVLCQNPNYEKKSEEEVNLEDQVYSFKKKV